MISSAEIESLSATPAAWRVDRVCSEPWQRHKSGIEPETKSRFVYKTRTSIHPAPNPDALGRATQCCNCKATLVTIH